MTSTQILHYPSTSALLPSYVPPANAPALRLHLDPTLCRLGTVDGAWWPYSDNAREELPALIAELDRRLGTVILRVGLHPDAWADIPRRMPARGRVVKVGWFRSIDLHLISLHTARGGDDLKLLVIPAGTAEAAAATAFMLAEKGKGSALSADILLNLAIAGDSIAARAADVAAHHTWDDDGGHIACAPPVLRAPQAAFSLS